MTETVKIDKVKASHRKIYTDITINAPAEQVWDIIQNTKSYKQWASFLIDIEGEIKDGNKITAKFQLNPSKEKFNTIEHIIQVEEGKRFYWAEKGPMGICDDHHFIVSPVSDTTCRFIQSDEISKGLTWLLGGYLSKLYAKGYQTFNKSLKEEAESRFKNS